MARFKFKAVAPSGQVVEGEMVAPARDMVIDRLRSQHHLPVRVDEVSAGVSERIEPTFTTPPEMAPDRPEPDFAAPAARSEPEPEPRLEPSPRDQSPRDQLAEVIALRADRDRPRRGPILTRDPEPPEPEPAFDEPVLAPADWAEPPAIEPLAAGSLTEPRAEPAFAPLVPPPASPLVAPLASPPVSPSAGRLPASLDELVSRGQLQPSSGQATSGGATSGQATYRTLETAEPPPSRPAPSERKRKSKAARASMPRRLLPVFTRELQVLLSAGLPVDRALRIIVESTSDDRVAAAADRLLARVRSGAVLSEAMDGMPEQFDEFLRTAVRAGEAGGALPDVLDQVANYQERGARVGRAVRTALIYPAILAFASALSVILLLTLVVPQFEALFRQAGQSPPLLTQIVIGTSAGLRQYGWIAPIVGVVGWLFWRLRYGNARRRGALHARILRLPMIGKVASGVAVERFARALATLLGNGVPLPNALELVANSVPNRAIGAVVAAAVDRVKQGERLADALEDGHALPLLAVQLIRVGEEGGRLTEMLGRLSDIYADNVDVAVRRLIAIIEPALILIIGIIVGGIILSLLTAVSGINALAL